MAYDTLIVEVSDHVALIKLNRPDARNAINLRLLEELAAAMTAADANEKVRCIVLTGSDKVFAAGVDVKELSEKGFVDVFAKDLYAAQASAIRSVRKPVIAAVAGFALGGGCELAMMADIVIAADTARFGQPEINIGMVPGLGATQMLTRLVGRTKAMDVLLTGRFLDAEEAERAALVSRVVPVKKLMETAMEAAHKIAERSLLATMAIKEAVKRADETTLAEGLNGERRLFNAMFATEDRKEGMAAFLEERKAQFRDR